MQGQDLPIYIFVSRFLIAMIQEPPTQPSFTYSKNKTHLITCKKSSSKNK